MQANLDQGNLGSAFTNTFSLDALCLCSLSIIMSHRTYHMVVLILALNHDGYKIGQELSHTIPPLASNARQETLLCARKLLHMWVIMSFLIASYPYFSESTNMWVLMGRRAHKKYKTLTSVNLQSGSPRCKILVCQFYIYILLVYKPLVYKAARYNPHITASQVLCSVYSSTLSTPCTTNMSYFILSTPTSWLNTLPI